MQKEKNYFALKFNKSKLFNKLIDIFYIFNIPIPNRLITNGPQKLMNNVIKTFKKNKKVKFNSASLSKFIYLQFDNFGEDILKKLYNLITNSQVLVGPLFTIFNLRDCWVR